MQQTFEPASISIEVPDTFPGFTDNVSMYTMLFRSGSNLAEALAQMYKRTGQSSGGTVVSAACSIGAEVDSLLGLHSREGAGASLTMAGLDISKRALQIAETGEYLLPSLTTNPIKLQEDLEGFGFKVDVQKKYKIPGMYGRCLFGHKNYYKVDSAPVRRRHDVVFLQCDTSKEVPLEGEADLVLANNFLYHLESHIAISAICNLASMLNNRGVLSIGNNGIENDYKMGKNQIKHEIQYYDWLNVAARVLLKEYGLETIEHGTAGQPVMFAKTA